MLRISHWVSIAALVCAASVVGTAASAQDWRYRQSMAWAPLTPPDPGWYVGAGAGFDHTGDFTEVIGGTGIKIPTDNSVLVTGSFGYKWANHFRLEAEIAYDTHNVVDPFNGHAAITTGMVNGLYDVDLSNNFTFSVGGGIGVANFNYCTAFGAGLCTGGNVTGFAGQIIGELSYKATPNAAFFVQGRERVYSFDSSAIRDVSEQAALLGVRWYIVPAPTLRSNIR